MPMNGFYWHSKTISIRSMEDVLRRSEYSTCAISRERGTAAEGLTKLDTATCSWGSAALHMWGWDFGLKISLTGRFASSRRLFLRGNTVLARGHVVLRSNLFF